MSGITVQLDTMPAPVMAAHCRGLFEAIGSFFCPIRQGVHLLFTYATRENPSFCSHFLASCLDKRPYNCYKFICSEELLYSDDPDNQAKFEAWHKKKYGCLPKDTSYGRPSEVKGA